MLSKYSIYTRDEEIEIFNSSDIDKDFISSLKFHLTKREEAREMGIDIPLNLQEKESDSHEEGEIVSGDTTPF